MKLHDNRRQADLGCTLAPALHGQGYATEAVRAVLQPPLPPGTAPDLRRMQRPQHRTTASLLERAVPTSKAGAPSSP
ncbi:GNAT family N-acetyltransferase [Streptomyces sp. NEAU-S7GS2]|uniref:GNAT family N-acetyltransferase n=1 Tax=Streptomyces sp. NEAU-S7GS2 TaxID=2202000 RepID=UPI001EF51A33|nr:GNAT family N-acetyltransferase [Streptomyces sp. NEAU-S7GS2]